MTRDFLQIGYSKLDNLVQGGFSSRIYMKKRINKNDNFVRVSVAFKWNLLLSVLQSA